MKTTIVWNRHNFHRLCPPCPADNVEGQLSHTQTVAQVTLPNLRSLFLHRGNAYLEAFLARMNTPPCEIIHVWFFHQFASNFPHLSQSPIRIKEPQCDFAWIHFYPGEAVLIAPKRPRGTGSLSHTDNLYAPRLAGGVRDTGLDAIAPMLSVVELLDSATIRMTTTLPSGRTRSNLRGGV